MLPFLSRLRTSESFLRGLHARLARLPALRGLKRKTVRLLLPELIWLSLAGGEKLLLGPGQGYLVLTGTLGVFAAEGEGRRLIAAMTAGMGDAAGEGLERIALRDCEIAVLTQAGLQILVAHHPVLALALMQAMASCLTSPAPRRAKVFAFVPAQEGLGDAAFISALADTIGGMGARVACLRRQDGPFSAEDFARIEAASDIVLCLGEKGESAWTRASIRQADRVFLIAGNDRPLPQHLPAQGMVSGRPDLVLMRTASAGLPPHVVIKGEEFEACHHLRPGNSGDIQRLARCIAGRAVGLVFSGGGARGFAHIGIARALSEAGVPFDYLGGASMGAIVAAGLAAEWSVDELEARLREAFVETQPLSDYTLPLIALVKGRKMSRLLSSHFGRFQIENLARPFFCVSSDLTTGHLHEHRSGPLWRALRASAALPGIVPPVTWRGHLLVDGGVMNNLPVDVMARRPIGPLIASDVAGEADFSVRPPVAGGRSFWGFLWQRMAGMPSIFDILMRTGTVGSDTQRRLARDAADFLFEPALAGINPLDWKSFDRAVAEGYAHAARIIDKHGVPLTRYWCEGPAIALKTPR